ncbi:MAG: DUF1304 domain-containing protein [Bacteroidota bacterium]
METLIKILIGIIAAQHLYFFYFETFAWETTGRKIFRNYRDEFFKQTKSMAANQGLYNSFLSAGLIWTFFISDPTWSAYVAIFFLACVSIAGIIGALTASRKIFYIQGLPAIITLILIHLT